MRTAIRCPSCDVDIGSASARWCGGCGTALVTPDGPVAPTASSTVAPITDDELELVDTPEPTPRSRLVALLAVVAVIGGLAAIQAGREGEGDPRGFTARGDAARDGVVSLRSVEQPSGVAWSFRLSLPPLIAPGRRVLPADSVVYVADQGGPGGVTAHDPSTGAVLWTRQDLATQVIEPTVVSDTLIVPEVGGPIVAVGPDGTTRWRTDRSVPRGQPVDGGLAYTAGTRDLVVRDIADGTIRWRVDLTEALEASPHYVLDGGPEGSLLVVATRPAGLSLGASPELEEPLLVSLDAASGEIRWTTDLPDGLAWAQDPVAADGDLAVAVDVTEVVFYDAATGTEVARAPHRLSNRPLSVDVAAGHALLLDPSGTLIALGRDGEWRWSQPSTLPSRVTVRPGAVLLEGSSRVTVIDPETGGVLGGQPLPLLGRRGPHGPDGAAYDLREDGQVVRYDLDGGVAWTVPTPLLEVAAPAVSEEGEVVVPTGTGISVHRAEDGVRLWEFRSGRRESSLARELWTPVVTEDVVVVSPPDTQPLGAGGVYALRRTTGILAWSRLDDRPLPRGPLTLDRDLVLLPVGNQIHGHDPLSGRRSLAAGGGDLRGPIAADGGILVAATRLTASGGDGGRTLRAVTRADRTQRWEVPLAACTDPMITGDLVVVGTSEGIAAHDVATGAVRWTHAGPPTCLQLAASDGAVAAVEGVHDLVVLDRTDGTERWRVRLDEPAAASPVIAGRELLVPTLDGLVHAFDLVDGAPRWSVDVEGVPASSLVAADGRLVLLLRDGRLAGLR